MSEFRSPNTGIVRIRARRGWQGLDLREFWDRRELLWYLAWRDIRVRYKQTILGAGWAVVQPLVQMLVFSVFFGSLLKISSEGIAYPVFSFSALVPWTLFASVLGGSAGSLTGNAGLLTKVYFPRLLIPFANAGARLVDFGVAFIILMGMVLVYKIPLTLNLLFLPVFIVLLLICGMGIGLCLGAINVYYRDVGVLIPFLLQLWMFASPVVYSAKVLTNPTWRFLYGLNPMTGVLQGFRWCLLGSEPPGIELLLAFPIALIFFAVGLMVFQRVQRTMADIV